MAGKRNKKSKKSPPRKWDPEDVTRLLAWLDHCIEYGKDFDATVTSYLNSTSTTGETCDLDRVKHKLSSLWHIYGHHESKKYTDVYSRGTACLTGLDDEKIQQVNQLKGTLADANPTRSRYRLRSTSTLPTTPHQHLDYRRSPSDSSLSDAEIISTPDPPFLNYDDKKEDSTSVPVQSTFKRKRSDSTESEMLPNLRQYMTFDSKATQTIERPSRVTFVDQTSRHGHGIHLQDGFSADPGDSSRQETIESHKGALNLLKEEMEKKNRHISNLENRIFNLDVALLSSIHEHKEMQNCMKHHQYSLSDLRYENSKLQGKLKEIQSSRTLALKIEKHEFGPATGVIRDSLDELENHITEIASSLEQFFSIADESQLVFDEEANLDLLTQRLVNLKSNEAKDLVRESGISDWNIIRALVAVGLTILALESTFLDFLARDSVLLTKYRETILLQSDASTLRKIDLLAHESILAESYVEKSLIPARAEDLASQLAQILDPILGKELRKEPTIPILSSHQVPDDIDDMDSDDFSFPEVPPAESLRSVFAKALKIKSDLLLIDKRFHMSFVQPGTNFDPKTMKQDGWRSDGYQRRPKVKRPGNSSKRSLDDQSNSPVKLCLFPALYSLPSRSSDIEWQMKNQAAKYAVDYGNFVQKEEMPEAGPLLIAKAIVLI